MGRSPLKWPILCTAGIAVIVFYCIFTFTSLALFPTPYTPVKNWMSDLGNSSYNPKGAAVYNIGCIITGLALFPFYAGVHEWYTDERWRKRLLIGAQIFGFTSAFALIMIGVFSEDYLAQHIFWTQVFYITILVVLILANISLLTHPHFMRPIGYYGFAVALINLGFTISFAPLFEWSTTFTALGYVGLLAYNTFKAFGN